MNTCVLTDEQKMLLKLARNIVVARVKPLSEEVDHKHKFPASNLEVLTESGFVACMVPEELGGSAMDYWSQTMVLEEVAKECASTAYTIAQVAEVAECLLRCGTTAQKEEILPKICEGEYVVSAAGDNLPGAPFQTSVTAEKIEDGFILNGVKQYVPNAAYCDRFLLAAQEGEKLRWFLIQNDCDSVRVEATKPLLGFKGVNFYTLILDSYHVSSDMELQGNVWDVLNAAQTLDMAAIATGIAEGALAEATEYINQRVQFGKTIAQFENTQQVMAELLAKTYAAKSLTTNAAYVKDNGEDYICLAAMAKVVATDIVNVVARKGLQFMGGYGYTREYPIERKMRDAKMTELMAGETGHQKMIIATQLVVQQGL